MIKISNNKLLTNSGNKRSTNKVIKKLKIEKDNKWYADKYAVHGFIPFTLHIGLKNDGIKKDLRPPKGCN
jgi:hypothetical protein